MNIVFDQSNSMSYAAISPILANFNDALPSTRLYVKITSDDLHSRSEVYWELRDDALNITMRGNSIVAGDAYTAWNGSNEYPFSFVAGSFNAPLTIL